MFALEANNFFLIFFYCIYYVAIINSIESFFEKNLKTFLFWRPKKIEKSNIPSFGKTRKKSTEGNDFFSSFSESHPVDFFRPE